MARSYNRYRDIDDALLIEICQRFLDGEKTKPIAEWLTKLLGRTFNRESVYPQIERAARLEYLRLDPPRHNTLQQRIADQFKVNREEIHVISAQGDAVRDLVADATARHIVELIREVGRIKGSKGRVGVGLGGGGTVDRVARSLAGYLRKEFEVPDLTLHALSPGFDVLNPRTAPVSSFGYFHGIDTDIKYVGLFAQCAVPANNYDALKSAPGIAESFSRAKDIDIVITSCAGAADEHGELNHFMQMSSHDDGDETAKALREVGWLGDVTYRPFNEFGPIELEQGIRSVTLFELENLVERIHDDENKHVVLVAAPCGLCGKTKVDALKPLLTQHDTLKLWNHLFLDTRTAGELVPEAG